MATQNDQTETADTRAGRKRHSARTLISATAIGLCVVAVTRDKLFFEHGLIEARIKMPAGQVIHPAFWMLGTNLGKVGWPAAGEIDIIEIVNIGLEFHNAIHGPTEADPAVEWKQSFDGPAGTDLAADYHVHQLYREPGLIKIAIDGVVRGQYAKASAPPTRAD